MNPRNLASPEKPIDLRNEIPLKTLLIKKARKLVRTSPGARPKLWRGLCIVLISLSVLFHAYDMLYGMSILLSTPENMHESYLKS